MTAPCPSCGKHNPVIRVGAEWRGVCAAPIVDQEALRTWLTKHQRHAVRIQSYSVQIDDATSVG